MFQMALLLPKENNCAKLFWNPCINVEVMARTNPDGWMHAQRMHIHQTEIVTTMPCSPLNRNGFTQESFKHKVGSVSIMDSWDLSFSCLCYFSNSPWWPTLDSLFACIWNSSVLGTFSSIRLKNIDFLLEMCAFEQNWTVYTKLVHLSSMQTFNQLCLLVREKKWFCCFCYFK